MSKSFVRRKFPGRTMFENAVSSGTLSWPGIYGMQTRPTRGRVITVLIVSRKFGTSPQMQPLNARLAPGGATRFPALHTRLSPHATRKTQIQSCILEVDTAIQPRNLETPEDGVDTTSTLRRTTYTSLHHTPYTNIGPGAGKNQSLRIHCLCTRALRTRLRPTFTFGCLRNDLDNPTPVTW